MRLSAHKSEIRSNKKLFTTTSFVGGYDNRISLDAPANAGVLDANAKNKLIFFKKVDDLTASYLPLFITMRWVSLV
jgi:hypothetical protein